MRASLKIVYEMTEVPPSSEVIIVDTIPEHVRELRDTIREADKREIEGFGYSYKKGLWRSFTTSLTSKTFLINGKVGGIGGCGGSFLGDTGIPWLLTSNEVYKISPLKFTRIYQKEVYKMLNLFPRLENYCLADYTEALRLLDICGFTLGQPEKIEKGMYVKFTLERGN